MRCFSENALSMALISKSILNNFEVEWVSQFESRVKLEDDFLLSWWLEKWDSWRSISSKNDFKEECALDGGIIWALGCCSLILDNVADHLPIALAEALELLTDRSKGGRDSP